MKKIVLATGNPGKLLEFQQLLSTTDYAVVAQSDFDVPEAEETGLSFVENAIIKARNASKYTGLPALADDSGLEVDALDGQPGIYSSRFAGLPSNDQHNNQKLLDALSAIPTQHRTARFQCLLVLLKHELDPVPLIFQGCWEGRILLEPRGKNGFGYDSLFFVPEKNCSSAELSPEIKNNLSHRGKALAQLLKYLA
jgi:XTP/dITP diphosphohydrolase